MDVIYSFALASASVVSAYCVYLLVGLWKDKKDSR